jgi:hypothetical protein
VASRDGRRARPSAPGAGGKRGTAPIAATVGLSCPEGSGRLAALPTSHSGARDLLDREVRADGAAASLDDARSSLPPLPRRELQFAPPPPAQGGAA